MCVFQHPLLHFPAVSPDWFCDARAGGGRFIILIPCKKYQYVKVRGRADSPSSLQRQEIQTFKNSPTHKRLETEFTPRQKVYLLSCKTKRKVYVHKTQSADLLGD